MATFDYFLFFSLLSLADSTELSVFRLFSSVLFPKLNERKKKKKIAMFTELRHFVKSPPLWFVVLTQTVVQISMGGYGIVLKKFAQGANINSLVFSMLRDVSCIPVLGALAFAVDGILFPRNIREVAFFTSLGFFGIYLNQLLYIEGVYLSTASIASITQPSIPVWAALLAILSGTESRPPFDDFNGWLKFLGIFASVVGAVLMLAGGFDSSDGSNAENMTAGLFSLLGNTIAMACYVVLMRRFVFSTRAEHQPAPFRRFAKRPVTVTFWCYVAGAVFMSLSSIYVAVEEPSAFDLDSRIVAPLLYSVFISSSLAYLLLTYGSQHLLPSVITAFWPLQVAVTLVLSYLVFGEVLSAINWIGGVCILLGLVAVTLANHFTATQDRAVEQRGEEVLVGANANGDDVVDVDADDDERLVEDDRRDDVIASDVQTLLKRHANHSNDSIQ
jgi:drug/metabolite transporter (DMT)-like permease